MWAELALQMLLLWLMPMVLLFLGLGAVRVLLGRLLLDGASSRSAASFAVVRPSTADACVSFRPSLRSD